MPGNSLLGLYGYLPVGPGPYFAVGLTQRDSCSPQWTTLWQSSILIPPFTADLAHVRDQSEAASKRADEECQRAEAEKKKGGEQQLKVEGETGLREMRIQVAEQEAMTSTSRAISAERALAEATADRESLQTQV